MVTDYYADKYFGKELNAFVKMGIEEEYTKDYS
jgi:hypothetical protein